MSARECEQCDRRVWFAENSAAQAALARVRELCNEWASAGGAYRRHADQIRDAIDGEQVERSLEPSCTACDYGYPASACSSGCNCGAC